ncbi:MAG TPA: OPT/YSL family transporter, partial [Sphingomicrobium sp.]
LNRTLGFQGAPGADANSLAAPQAALISTIAQGILGGNLDWGLIAWGAGIGAIVVAIDEALRATKKGSLPPLAVGMGIYLPMGLTLLIPLGALLGRIYDNWAKRTSNPEFAERMGVLLATGLIVGESIAGVVFAMSVGATGKDEPLALIKENPWAMPLSAIVFAALVAGLYAWTRREASSAPVPEDHAEPPEQSYR